MKYILLICLFISINAFAQSNSNGNINNESLIFDKQRITKFNTQDPEIIKLQNLNRADSTYVYKAERKQNFNKFIYSLDIKLKKINQLKQINKINNISIGVGNYLSTYLDINYTYIIKKNNYVSVFLNHNATLLGEKKYSNYGKNAIMLKSTMIFNKFVLNNSLNIEGEKRHFYGIISEDKSQVQNIKRIEYKINLLTNHNIKQTSLLNLDLFSTTSKYLVENGFMLHASSSYLFNKFLTMGIKGNSYISNFKNGYEEYQRGLVSGEIFSLITKNNLSIKPKLSVSYTKDFRRSKVYLNPGIFSNYKFSSRFELNLELTSMILQNTLNSQLEKNPWLRDSSNISYMSIPVMFNIKSIYNYNIVNIILSYKYAIINNTPYLYSSSNNLSNLSLRIYNKEVYVQNAYIAADIKISNNVSLGTKVTYNNYSNIDAHLFPYYSKFLFESYLTYVRNRCASNIGFKSRSSQSLFVETSPSISPLTDLYITVDYSLTPRLLIWGKVNNLLNNQNDYFYMYRNNGILGMIGASFKF